MTYYAMLSMAPTLMISIAIASYIFDGQLAEAEILTTIQQFTTPEIAQTIAGLIKRANLPQSGFLAGSFSIGIFLFGASGVFSQLFDTFNFIWHVDGKKQGFWFGIQKRCIGIVMVLIVGLMLIGALVLNSVMAYVTQLMEGHELLLIILVRSGYQSKIVGRNPGGYFDGVVGNWQSLHHSTVPRIFIH